MNKKHKIFIGTFSGSDLFVETTQPEKNWGELYENYIDYVEKNAVERYLGKQEIRKLDIRSKIEERNESIGFRLYQKLFGR